MINKIATGYGKYFLPKAGRVFSLPSGKGKIEEQILKIPLILSEKKDEFGYPIVMLFGLHSHFADTTIPDQDLSD